MTTQWAVITGAGNGLGKVIAYHAVKEGYQVAAWDLNAEAIGEVASALGESCSAAAVDVTDEGSVEFALDGLPEAPTLLVNSAGVVRFGPLMDLSVQDWECALQTNLTGTFVVSRAVAKRMSSAGSGSIVSLGSINGVAAAPNSGAYSSSKAGVSMLTEQMAMEWARYGIRVNAVAPGLIDAGMSDAIYADPEVRRLREARVPIGRLGSADDVATAVMFLGSAKAAYVTGQTLTVDGGLTKSALASLPRPQSVDSVGVD